MSQLTRPCDTLVLGAGVFGLATAVALAHTGRRVVVADWQDVAQEASGYALGRLDPLILGWKDGTDTNPHRLERTGSEAELALLSWKLHLQRRNEIANTAEMDCQFDDQPTLQFLNSASVRSDAERLAPMWRKMDFAVDLLDREDVLRMNSQYRCGQWGAIYLEGAFFWDSARFTRALAECARRLEVRIVRGVAMAGSNGAYAQTDDGNYYAPETVIALGPWSTPFCEQLGIKSLPIEPSKGELLRLKPPSDFRLEHHLHGACSVVLKRDGYVWVAATAGFAGFDKQPTAAARDHLLKQAATMLDGVTKLPIAMHSVCLRPASPDGLPVLGRLPIASPTWIVSGGSGTGILHCLTVGDEAAAMVANANDEPETRYMSINRFR